MKASVDQLVPNDIPIPVSGTFPLSAIRLRAGQSVISKTASVRDIVDMRWAGYSVLSDTKEVFVLQDGVLVVSAREIDFTGSGVTVTSSGSRATVEIVAGTGTSGGGGGGSNYGLHPGIVTGTLIVPADWRMIHLGPMSLAAGASVTLESGTNAILL